MLPSVIDFERHGGYYWPCEFLPCVEPRAKGSHFCCSGHKAMELARLKDCAQRRTRARCPDCKEYFDLLFNGDTDCPHCGHDGRE